MSISQLQLISIDEFYKLREDTENGLEYIDGIVYMTPSPSTKHQRISSRFKLNLYMQYGVKEYWIVNPLLNIVQIYALNNEGQYHQVDALKEKGIAYSEVLKGFSMNLEELFR